MRIALQLALIVFSFPLLCSADEIITRDGKKVQGTIRKIAEKRVIITSGGVGQVYWLKNIDTIRVGADDSECPLTYKVDFQPDAADFKLPSPSYDVPDLEYTSAFVESAVSGSELVLGPGQRVTYYGIKVPDDALARAVNREMCEKKKVDIHVLEDTEAIVVCDGEFVNAKLIEEGLALADTGVPDGELKTLFLSLECHAEALGNGRWGLDAEKGKKVLPGYLSPEEIRENEILGYCVKGETLQQIDWKEISPRPPGLSFSSLRGCTISIGGQAPRKSWTGGEQKSAPPEAAPPPAAAPPGGAPEKPSTRSERKK